VNPRLTASSCSWYPTDYANLSCGTSYAAQDMECLSCAAANVQFDGGGCVNMRESFPSCGCQFTGCGSSPPGCLWLLHRVGASTPPSAVLRPAVVTMCFHINGCLSGQLRTIVFGLPGVSMAPIRDLQNSPCVKYRRCHVGYEGACTSATVCFDKKNTMIPVQRPRMPFCAVHSVTRWEDKPSRE
jgi:hypothetical protein